MLFGFTTMIVGGVYMYKSRAPIPDRVVGPAGQLLFTADDIQQGQELFRKRNLMNYGTVLGHGAYLGPDYTAEALHKMTEAMRAERTLDYAVLGVGDRAKIDAEIGAELKENRYSGSDGSLTFTPGQTAGWYRIVDHYSRTFAGGNEAEALPRNALLPVREGGDGLRTTGELHGDVAHHDLGRGHADQEMRLGGQDHREAVQRRAHLAVRLSPAGKVPHAEARGPPPRRPRARRTPPPTASRRVAADRRRQRRKPAATRDPTARCAASCAAARTPVSYTHLRAHETVLDLVCRLLLEKKKDTKMQHSHSSEICNTTYTDTNRQMDTPAQQVD